MKEPNEPALPDDSELGFPKTYTPIDEAFIEKYASAIAKAKTRYKPTGGIMRLDVGERSIIVRVPSDTILKDIRKRSADAKLDPFDSDRMLVKQCLLYPSEAILDQWMTLDGKVGICSAFGASMMQEAELSKVATAKKF